MQKKFDKTQIIERVDEIIVGSFEKFQEEYGNEVPTGNADVLSNKMNDKDLICKTCYDENLVNNYTLELWEYNKIKLTYKEQQKFNLEHPGFVSKVRFGSSIYKERREFNLEHPGFVSKVQFEREKKLKKEFDQKQMNEVKIKNDDDSESLFICHWCKKQLKISQINPASTWLIFGNPQCTECTNIIRKLSSSKLKELWDLEQNMYKKMELLRTQIYDAGQAVRNANMRSTLDIFTGESTFGIARSETQQLKNLANQHESSLKTDLEYVKNEIQNIPNQIKKEKIRLAEKHFFENDEKLKVIPKTENPLEILKIRLAKGEITIDEFNELKSIL
jgi:hypothetical protein